MKSRADAFGVALLNRGELSTFDNNIDSLAATATAVYAGLDTTFK